MSANTDQPVGAEREYVRLDLSATSKEFMTEPSPTKAARCVKCGHNNVNNKGECRQCIDWQKHVCVFPAPEAEHVQLHCSVCGEGFDLNVLLGKHMETMHPTPEAGEPLTVEEALKELRAILGAKSIFELQIACDMFGNTHYRLVGFTFGFTSITSSVEEAVAQVRRWKESQQ